MKTRIARVSFLVLAAAGSTLSVAGPLDPPAGPVAPTMKTLQQVEPRTALSAASTPGDADTTPSVFKITQPGSYYLAADLVVTGDAHGIEVASHNVSIDLNGFTIRGANAANRAGIFGNLHQLRNVSVSNGAIRDFALAGVTFTDNDDWSRPRVGRIERLRVSNCGVGIGAGGEYTVADCVVSGGTTGISGWGELLVERCHVLNTSGAGISSITQSSTVVDCRVDDAGTYGVQLTQGSVERCEIKGADMAGVRMLSAGAVRGCSISNSGGYGIEAGPVCMIEHNRVYAYVTAGIRADQFCRVVDNQVFYSFATDPGSTQVGIQAFGGSCHIEGNTVSKGDVGVQAMVGGCHIVRNVFSDVPSAWNLSGTHTFGPLISATGTITTTNPWANFAN